MGQFNNTFPNKPASLSSWISRLKVKKNKYQYQRRQNLFIEAVLSNALARAHHDLNLKREERAKRWREQLSKYVSTSEVSESNTIPSSLDPKLCEEINADIDSFMTQLKTSNLKSLDSNRIIYNGIDNEMSSIYNNNQNLYVSVQS